MGISMLSFEEKMRPKEKETKQGGPGESSVWTGETKAHIHWNKYKVKGIEEDLPYQQFLFCCRST